MPYFKNNNHFTAKTTTNKGRDMRHGENEEKKKKNKDRMRELAHNLSVVLCPVFVLFVSRLSDSNGHLESLIFVVSRDGKVREWDFCKLILNCEFWYLKG